MSLPALPIETERLSLRAFRPDDFDAYYAYHALPEVYRYLYAAPPSAEDRRHTVLLVEDELLVAMAVQEMFDELGYEVVGPVARLDEAIAAARSESLDAALLDISLAGTLSYPVADVLVARGVPFVFASGYGLPPDRNDYSGIPTLVKPYRISQLEQVLAGLIRKTASD